MVSHYDKEVDYGGSRVPTSSLDGLSVQTFFSGLAHLVREDPGT